MGNRGGRIHDDWRIKRRQGSARWIICVLAFKSRQRIVMQSGYTELFFLDEATALAAGHRPCFECRRADARAFAAAFGQERAGDIDAVLTRERRGPKPDVTVKELAPGAMVAAGGDAFLFDGDGFHRWSFEGYTPGAPAGALTLLTPAATLAALHAGYRAGMATANPVSGSARPPA
ncbi:MAG: hypothetical protein WD969_12475 [Paracoccaceae bacterium]